MKFKEIKEFIKSGADNIERWSTVLFCAVRPLLYYNPQPPFLLDNTVHILSLTFALIYMRARNSHSERQTDIDFSRKLMFFLLFSVCCGVSVAIANRPNMIWRKCQTHHKSLWNLFKILEITLRAYITVSHFEFDLVWWVYVATFVVNFNLFSLHCHPAIATRSAADDDEFGDDLIQNFRNF